MQAEKRIETALVIDLDVHQGNGTAQILRNDTSIFTFSMHGEKNYPFRKESSDLDIALADGTDNETYLDALNDALQTIAPLVKPDLIFYLAGADVFEHDRLGTLALTKLGIARRDARVFDFAANAYNKAVPVVVAMGGGYCPVIDDIVDIHLSTVKTAFGFYTSYNC
jgi:acetoin utilization deacetylase AcuC-like enzyme